VIESFQATQRSVRTASRARRAADAPQDDESSEADLTGCRICTPGSSWLLIGASAPGELIDDTDKAILKAMARRPQITTQSCAARAGCTPPTAQRRLKRLKERGLVTNSIGWTATAEARTLLGEAAQAWVKSIGVAPGLPEGIRALRQRGISSHNGSATAEAIRAKQWRRARRGKQNIQHPN
jgi:hypothetical protein